MAATTHSRSSGSPTDRRTFGRSSAANHAPTESKAHAPPSSSPYDADAVSVWVSGLHVGSLSAAGAGDYRPGLLRLAASGPVALSGVIVGGGYSGPSMLGVFLHHDPEDFGLEPSRSPEPHVRTGLSEALISDAADDSYDLGWLPTLPQDAPEAVTALRGLLEHDPT